MSGEGRHSNRTIPLQEAVDSAKVNRFGGHYLPGAEYSATRIAECVDSCKIFTSLHGREPTVKEFMKVAKIGGQDLVRKITHSAKYGVDLTHPKRGNGF